MENFIVSARKYRPARFPDVLGQGHVTKTLQNAIKNNQIPQALLFCGPRGVGKTTCARIFAKVINQQGSEAREQEDFSFNIFELDAASNNSVDDIRTLVERVRIPPQTGKYKVYIIDEVHMLSQQAFNAFLKTLEEPPPYAIFILATTEKHKILPTILSRCQIYDFNRIHVNEMMTHLKDICDKEGLEYEVDALHLIAQKADGALRDALSIFDRIVSFSDKKIKLNEVLENLNILDYDYYFKITDQLLVQNRAELLLTYNNILTKGFEGDLFLEGLSQHFRDLLVCKDEATLPLLEISENLKDRYREQSSYTPSAFLLSSLNIANKYENGYRMSKNKRLHVEMALLKMCYITDIIAAGDSFIPPLKEEIKKKSLTKQKPLSPEKISPEPSIIPEALNNDSSDQPESHLKSNTGSFEKEDKKEEDTGTSSEVGQKLPSEEAQKPEAVSNPSEVPTTPDSPEDSNKSHAATKKVKFKKPSAGPAIGSYETLKKKFDKSISSDLTGKAEEKEGGEDLSDKVMDFSVSSNVLEENWKEIAAEVGKERVSTVLKNYRPKLNEKNQVELIVGNKVEFEIVSEDRMHINSLLKEKLGSQAQFTLDWDRNTKQSNKKDIPYTAKEKYEKMREKNPLLDKLKDTFGLEIEH